MSAVETVAEDAIYFFDRRIIHPDPEQPRVAPDDELRASILQSGIIQAITVRPHPDIPDEWMIVDGERRWIGAEGVSSEVPCRIRLDLEEPVDRLVAQLTANTGKPLSPIEEAFAFQTALEADPELSQSDFAKRLGRARSTIGDRLRMLDLAPAWITLLKTGKIQPSHTPFLHKYRAIPERFHAEVADAFLKEYRANELYLSKGESVPVDVFESVVRPLFDKHLRPIGKGAYPEWPDNAAAYEGPVIELNEFGRTTKYAADPSIWRPIVRSAHAQKNAEARKDKKSGKHVAATPPHLQLPAGAGTVKQASYNYGTPKGFTEVVDRDGRWHVRVEYNGDNAFDVDVFVANVEPEKLATLQGGYGGPAVVTNDTAAYGLARSAWIQRWDKRRQELLVELRAFLADPLFDLEHGARGKGVRALLLQLVAGDEDRKRSQEIGISGQILEIAQALDVPGADKVKGKDVEKFVKKCSDEVLSAIATRYAAMLANKRDAIWKILQREQEAARQGYMRRAVSWKGVGKTKMADNPSAGIDVGEIRAAVEAGEAVDEEELVEA